MYFQRTSSHICSQFKGKALRSPIYGVSNSDMNPFEAKSTITRSALAIVRDILRLFDPEGAAGLETRLADAGARYLAETIDGRPVVVTVRQDERLAQPPRNP